MLPALHPAGIAVGALLAGIGLVLAEGVVGPLLVRSWTTPEGQVLGMVHERLAGEYVEPRDPVWLLHRGVEGMLAGLEDPYTFFVGPEELTALEEESSGSLIGIGVVLNLDSAHVRYPVPGGPAEAAGIRPGDRILEVDGLPAEGLEGEELARRIKGPAGTEVVLTVLGPGESAPRQVRVRRAPVPTGTVGKVEMLEPGIGRIHIRSFAHSTPEEFEEALQTLEAQGLRALILDLRFNTGGVLQAAVDVAATFVGREAVCTLRGRKGPLQVRRGRPRGEVRSLPLVVLLNGYSASGSEVLAGALRDHGVAVLVGEPSYGKGVYQQVLRYEDWDFAFKFTAGFYLTPSGRILESRIGAHRAGGLEPDLWLPGPREEEAALLTWLRYDPPPERYRELVYRLFPNVAAYSGPPDPVEEAARELLRRSLEEES